MKTRQKTLFAIVGVLIMIMALLTGGCASKGQISDLQAQIDMAMQKADDAQATAEAAKRATDDCSTQCDQAARDAQIAADRAVAAADKSEAIFMQKMKK